MKTMENRSVPCREQVRLIEADENGIPWRKWGPYLSERQWGTVREDYSEGGDAWNYFTHDQARSRAYRWGEDGIAGISDDKQLLCFAVALWNGRDPILKERMFGLSNGEGNHGEDVKEYYFYLDNTPTHSYMKYLYKYPQAAYPYRDLIETNRKRSRFEFEYELLDTGIFNENRYFDVFIEYAKQSPEDILIQITAANRGPDPATLHLLPTLWFRNTWSFAQGGPKPQLKHVNSSDGITAIGGSHSDLGEIYFCCDRSVPLLFTENETNNKRIYGSDNGSLYVKDGINDYVVLGEDGAVNPGKVGTKVAAHCVLQVEPGQSQTVRLRLITGEHVEGMLKPFSDFPRIFQDRKSEADEFYKAITPERVTGDEALIMRQALSGMLWSKQYFNYDLNTWLSEHGVDPMHANSREIRNSQWYHMVNRDVISMPDKWEYPWYAAWDLAFHTIALSTVDPVFAEEQLELLLNELYKHPIGQLPAYEWNFSDVNPPVHAWAAIFLHRMNVALDDKTDLNFLKRCFGRLSANFDWWINQKDRHGKNLFEGGFLGLDNIGVFDRSAPLPTGGYLEQADGTAWIALFCQNMLEISAELAHQNPSYGDVAARYLDQFIWIARAMYMAGSDGMWDEEDGFFYDVLRLPDGSAQRLKVRSMVGLLPLCATTVFEPWMREELPAVMNLLEMRVKEMPELANALFAKSGSRVGVNGRGLISLVDEHKLRRVLARMLDENEFLSPYGLRAVSRYHAENPYVFRVGSQEYMVDYEPAESNTSLFGGNSNWRGPIWMPVNVLVIRALWQFYMYYGNDFLVECPTGSGHLMNLFEVAQEITNRLTSIFLRDSSGRRPVYGGMDKFQNDPHWKDYILFHEYFHGDNGAGLGASHQTGWTGVIAKLIELFGQVDAEVLLQKGKANVATAPVSKNSDSTVIDRRVVVQSS